MKRKETICLENTLIKQTKEKRIYGCEEITIGFYRNGHGDEIVDFMTMDSKGIIKCYELKVTLQDLKSDAKKSWYGHFNYLVVTQELYSKVDNWDDYIPQDIGIIVGKGEKYQYLESKRRSKKKTLSKDDEIMLKESMIRSMYWKMVKYKNADSLEREKELNSLIRKAQKEKDTYRQRAIEAENIILKYETYVSANTGIDIDLSKMAEEAEKYYRENRRKQEKK